VSAELVVVAVRAGPVAVDCLEGSERGFTDVEPGLGMVSS